VAKSTFKTNLNPKENFGENVMDIYYFDKTGQKQESCLVGYFEKGYSGKCSVEILSIDENGKLDINIDFKYY